MKLVLGVIYCGNSVEQFLEAGTKLLAAGQLADALSQFHSAVGKDIKIYTPIYVHIELLVNMTFLFVDADPNSYMSYYRRATVYLATGKFKPALQDFSRVIELKPDFTSVGSNCSIFLLSLK